MSDIEDIAEEYRRQLNANEKQLLTEIARSWAKVIIKMEGEYKSLLEVVEQAKAEGQPISRSWLSSLTSYRHMKAQAEELTETFADGTVDRVQAMKKADAQLGLDQANDMLGVLAPNSPDWTRLNVSGLENMSANLADGSPLKKLIMESAKESAQEVETALITGIAIGQSVSHLGWYMSKVSNLPYERAYRIARTEIARAYRSASHEQYKKSGIISGYRRMCYKPTACFACLMMDGEFYPIGQGALQDHPNGKCTPIPVLEGHENDTPSWQTGRAWFMHLPEDEQRKLMGNGRFDLWRNKQIRDLTKFVEIKDNAIWGGQPSCIALRDLNYSKDSASIDFDHGGFQLIETMPNMIDTYGADDPGKVYALSKPVIYNDYTSRHITMDHPERRNWLFANEESVIKAVTQPEFVERKLRHNNNGHYSATHIVKAINQTSKGDEYLAVAISFDLETTPTGFHQITTIHQMGNRQLFYKNGELKDKFIKLEK